MQEQQGRSGRAQEPLTPISRRVFIIPPSPLKDVSVGKMVAELRTKLGPCSVMRQNPWNAVLHLGHTNGTVTLWSPNMTTPLVKQLCHVGPLQGAGLARVVRFASQK